MIRLSLRQKELVRRLEFKKRYGEILSRWEEQQLALAKKGVTVRERVVGHRRGRANRKQQEAIDRGRLLQEILGRLREVAKGR
jgi:hypothetical protein